MTNIYILYTGGGETVFPSIDPLPERIENTKNEQLRRQRAAAHLLLIYAYRDFAGETLPEIVYDTYGRPSFNGADTDFNISHDRDMIALIISDSQRVGIDVQALDTRVSDRLAEGIAEITQKENFISVRSRTAPISDKTVLLSISQNGDIIEDTSLFILNDSEKEALCKKEADIISDWTLLEALVKADGRGIGQIKAAGKLISSAKTKELFISAGGCVYSLSAVEKMPKP